MCRQYRQLHDRSSAALPTRGPGRTTYRVTDFGMIMRQASPYECKILKRMNSANIVFAKMSSAQPRASTLRRNHDWSHHFHHQKLPSPATIIFRTTDKFWGAGGIQANFIPILGQKTRRRRSIRILQGRKYVSTKSHLINGRNLIFVFQGCICATEQLPAPQDSTADISVRSTIASPRLLDKTPRWQTRAAKQRINA